MWGLGTTRCMRFPLVHSVPSMERHGAQTPRRVPPGNSAPTGSIMWVQGLVRPATPASFLQRLGLNLAPRARPPPAAFAHRDRRQPQAHCVRWGIIAWVAPVTKHLAMLAITLLPPGLHSAQHATLASTLQMGLHPAHAVPPLLASTARPDHRRLQE